MFLHLHFTLKDLKYTRSYTHKYLAIPYIKHWKMECGNISNILIST